MTPESITQLRIQGYDGIKLREVKTSSVKVNVTPSTRKEDREKRQSSGTGEGRLFGTEPDLKLNRITVSSGLVVLLRSTKQHN